MHARDLAEKLAATSVDGVIAFDREFRYTVWNPAMERLTGVGAHQVMGRNAFDVFPFIRDTGLDRAMADAIEGRPRSLFGLRYSVPETGREGYFDVHYSTLHDDDGNIAGGLGIIHEATFEKQAREAIAVQDQLRTSEERYRAFIEQSSEGIWRFELDRTIPTSLPAEEQVDLTYRHAYLAECNDAMARMYGFESAADLIGARLADMMPSSDATNVDYLRSFFRSGFRLNNAESHEIDRQGNPKYFLNNLIGIVENGGLVRAWGTQRDITEQKRAEENLRISRERLDLVLGSVQIGLWYCDLPFDKLEWNERCKEHFWLAPDAEVTIDTFFTLLHPEDREKTERAIDQSIETRQPYDVEYRTVSAEGQVKWIRAIGKAFYKPDGQPMRFDGITVDITDQKLAEQALVRQAQELALSNADLQQFAYVTSHDLQEPLRMIASFTQLLQQRYSGKLDSDADDFIGYITSGVHRMSQLIRDLLAFSRVVTPESPPATAVEMDGTLHWALMNLELAIKDAGAQVTADPLPVVMGNQIQLVQLLQNLISNGIKYRRDREPPSIHISAERSDSVWIFAVRDNGIGIDKRYHRQIFGVFKRLHGREVPGTGIGLSICKKIVEKHEGRIWVESEEGKGSTFYFTLPAAANC
jgi:PAS domain S-box-containing protein